MITDIEFFVRNPEREYRLRLAFPEEIAALENGSGAKQTVAELNID
jgi:hypothetical protein